MSDVGIVWFPSKVDWWLGILLVFPPIAAVAALASGIAASDRAEIIVGVITCISVVAMYGLLVIPIRYGVGPGELIIRFGVVRQRVGLDTIQEVSPTHNPLSSPALSVDRLAIRTGPGMLSTTMISPADKEGFLTALALYAGLRREGDRLVNTKHSSRDA